MTSHTNCCFLFIGKNKKSVSTPLIYPDASPWVQIAKSAALLKGIDEK
jgi:hypothetical protein